MKKIKKMSQFELDEYAAQLGSRQDETYAETADRLELAGDEKTAEILREMETRWYELEG